MTKRKNPPKYVWVSLEAFAPGDRMYQIWTHKPRRHGCAWYSDDEHGARAYCMDDLFELLFGLTLQPGECRRVRWRSPFAEDAT